MTGEEIRETTLAHIPSIVESVVALLPTNLQSGTTRDKLQRELERQWGEVVMALTSADVVDGYQNGIEDVIALLPYTRGGKRQLMERLLAATAD